MKTVLPRAGWIVGMVTTAVAANATCARLGYEVIGSGPAQAGSDDAGAAITDGGDARSGDENLGDGSAAPTLDGSGATFDTSVGGNGGMGASGGAGGDASAADSSGGADGAADAVGGTTSAGAASGIGGAGGMGAVSNAGGAPGAGGGGGMGIQGGAGGGASGSSDAAAGGNPGDAASDTRSEVGANLCSGGICKRVFLTSTVTSSAVLGGLSGGDATCQSLANARALGGTWKAWLSDNAASPSTRFTHASVPYVLMNGTVVANDWSDLTDGALNHAIDVDETASAVPSATDVEVWTGTTATGVSSMTNCGGWTSATVCSEPLDVCTTANGIAQVGLFIYVDSGWTAIWQQYCDRARLRMYCFEQ